MATKRPRPDTALPQVPARPTLPRLRRGAADRTALPPHETDLHDARAALRGGTREEHEALERELALTRDGLTLGDYTRLLVRFHGLYSRLEVSLQAWEEDWDRLCLDWQARRKLPLLERDLRALLASEVPPRPDVPLPALTTLPRALGCLYVVEGSTLGGQLLTRHFGERLRLTPETGLAFFAGYRDETGPRWRQFLETLGRELSSPARIEEAVTAARATFTAFRVWLREGS